MRLAGLRSLVLLWSVACADAPESSEPVDETAVPIADLSSGASCGSASMLTYAAFGSAFMSAYCLKCHTQAIVGSARQAPPDKNFDELTAIRAFARLIDQQAGAGPTGVHAVMPPGGVPAPTLEQRYSLSAWLACGAPK